MSTKEQIKVEVLGKVVKVTINAVEDELKILNAYVEGAVEILKYADAIKWYNNRIDFFMVMPQDGWQPVELMIELKKLLRL